MFEITMIGTSSGVPTPQRGMPAIALRRENVLLLFDCGEGTQRQMMCLGISYMKVRGIFLSHLHLDHYLGIFGLIETMALNGRQDLLEIFGPPGTRKSIGTKYELRPFVKINEIQPGSAVDFGSFTVRAVAVLHTQNSLGFVIEEKEKIRFYEERAHLAGLRGKMFSEILEKGELSISGKKVRLKDLTYVQKGKKVAYSGDTAPCADFAKAAKDSDLIIHEATFSSELEQDAKEANHSTAAQAAAIAKKARAKRLILTHISGRYKDPSVLVEEARKIFPATEAAYDGMKLQV
ncbi:MAG: ribonuclease Z [Candidatus Anstonellaceae archaeon]